MKTEGTGTTWDSQAQLCERPFYEGTHDFSLFNPQINTPSSSYKVTLELFNAHIKGCGQEGKDHHNMSHGTRVDTGYRPGSQGEKTLGIIL